MAISTRRQYTPISDRRRRSHSLDGYRTKKMRVTLTLSPSLVQLLDSRAKRFSITRSTALDRLLRDALKDDAGELVDEITDRLAPALKKKPASKARSKRR